MLLANEKIVYDISSMVESYIIELKDKNVFLYNNYYRDSVIEKLKDITLQIKEELKERYIKLENLEKRKNVAEKTVSQMALYRKNEADKYEKVKSNYMEYDTILKTQILKIDFKDLRLLKDTTETSALFKLLYTMLFNEEESTFSFTEFQKIFKKENISKIQGKIAGFKVYDLTPKYCDDILKINNYSFKDFPTNKGLNNMLIWLEVLVNTYDSYKNYQESEENYANVKLKEKEYLNNKVFCDAMYNETCKFIEKHEDLINNIINPFVNELEKADVEMSNNRVPEFNVKSVNNVVRVIEEYKFN